MSKVIDFHTHVLPSMDDGSRSVDESLEMLKNEREQGIDKIILTPHFYANHDSPRNFLERRARSAELLKSALSGMEEAPEIVLGAEVHYFEGMSDSEHLEELLIEGTRCILIEPPMRRWDERMLLELASIRPKRQITPVIAHIDRYMSVLRLRVIPEQLLNSHVYFQANAGFFIKRTTRRAALRLLSEQKIHFLGSDCHDLCDRAPNLRPALEIIERKLDETAIKYINGCEKNIFGL